MLKRLSQIVKKKKSTAQARGDASGIEKSKRDAPSSTDSPSSEDSSQILDLRSTANSMTSESSVQSHAAIVQVSSIASREVFSGPGGREIVLPSRGEGEYDYVWSSGPLGLSIIPREEDGQPVVKRFTGSNFSASLSKIAVGDVLISANDLVMADYSFSDCLKILENAPRPCLLRFKVARLSTPMPRNNSHSVYVATSEHEESYERPRSRSVVGYQSADAGPSPISSERRKRRVRLRLPKLQADQVEVVWKYGPLGISVKRGHPMPVIVSIKESSNLSASNLAPGDLLLSVNERNTLNMSFKEVLEYLCSLPKPVVLRFQRQGLLLTQHSMFEGGGNTTSKLSITQSQSLIESRRPRAFSGDHDLELVAPAHGESASFHQGSGSEHSRTSLSGKRTSIIDKNSGLRTSISMPQLTSTASRASEENPERIYLPPLQRDEFEVLWERDALGITFKRGPSGLPSIAKMSMTKHSDIYMAQCQPGDELLYVNNRCTIDMGFRSSMEYLVCVQKPAVLRFRTVYFASTVRNSTSAPSADLGELRDSLGPVPVSADPPGVYRIIWSCGPIGFTMREDRLARCPTIARLTGKASYLEQERISVGDMLLSVNDKHTADLGFEKTMLYLKRAPKPLLLRIRSCDVDKDTVFDYGSDTETAVDDEEYRTALDCSMYSQRYANLIGGGRVSSPQRRELIPNDDGTEFCNNKHHDSSTPMPARDFSSAPVGSISILRQAVVPDPCLRKPPATHLTSVSIVPKEGAQQEATGIDFTTLIPDLELQLDIERESEKKEDEPTKLLDELRSSTLAYERRDSHRYAMAADSSSIAIPAM